MADRAIRQENSERDVFDLEKDERWQARLAEARARRAIALREKANSEGPPKPRLKPWETAGQNEPEVFEPVEPLLHPDTEDKLDFSDRVRTLRETVEGLGGNGGPTLDAQTKGLVEPDAEKREVPIARVRDEPATDGAEPKARPASVADRYIKALSPDFIPTRPFVPDTGNFSEPSPLRRGETRSADDTEALAREQAASMDLAPEAQPVTGAAAEPVPRRRRGVPALLLAGVCLLAALPFTETVAPLAKGPVSNVVTPQFGLAPALGITRPMNAFPRKTASGEWRPVSNRPPRGALVLPLDLASAQQRSVDPLVSVSFGDEVFGPLGWTALASLPELPEVAFPGAPGADRLPGVDEVVPDPGTASVGAPLPAPLSLLSVTVLVPRTTDPSIADEIAADLTARGHSISAVTSVNMRISERNVRFFHEEDRGEAALLAEAYDARLRDFTSFRPSPAEGTVEIWLAGAGITPPPVAAAPQRQVEPQVVTPRVVIVRRTPSFLERLTGVLGGHEGDGLPAPALDDGPSVARPAVQPAPTATSPSSGTEEPAEEAAGEATDGSETDAGTSDDAGGTETTDTSSSTGNGGGNGNSGNGGGNGGSADDGGSDTTSDSGTESSSSSDASADG